MTLKVFSGARITLIHLGALEWIISNITLFLLTLGWCAKKAQQMNKNLQEPLCTV